MRKQVQYRLLVVRLGAMGDILHALPAITALRQIHPTWKIDWAVEPRWRPLLSAEPQNPEPDESRTIARPLVDYIHPVPSKAWGKQVFTAQTWKEVGELRAGLRRKMYDAVLDLQGAIRSSVVARLAGSRRVIGEASPREWPARLLFTEHVRTIADHVIDQDVELAGAVAGDLLSPMQPVLPVDAVAEDWCENFQGVREARWYNKPIVLIHPGAGWGAKRWPAERYGVVAEEFGRRGAMVLINAGPGEISLAASVVDASHGMASVMITSLPQLISVTRRAALVIGGDTGPLHLGCALGKPVIGIYGPTDPRRNGPYGSRFRVLRNPESRSDHTRREQPEAGLLTIRPEAVMDAALDLMVTEEQNHLPAPQVQDFLGSHLSGGAGKL